MTKIDFDQNDTGIKIILLGEAGVGKTNLIGVSTGLKFTEDTKSSQIASFREGCYEAKNGKAYIFNLWDTAGQELYRSLNKIYIKDSKIVLVVYAIDNLYSFEQVDYWINYVKSILIDNEYILALVGNKSDRYEDDKAIPDEKAKSLAQKYNIKYKITSALTEAASFKLFLYELIDDYIKLIGPNREKDLDTKTIKISKKIQKKDKTEKKGCC